MKIVTREEFLKLPEGTLYSKYQPCVLDEMHIKGQSDMGDFCCICVSDPTNGMLGMTGNSIPVDLEMPYRDGFSHVQDQLFAVWELDDLKALAQVVNRAMELAQQ